MLIIRNEFASRHSPQRERSRDRDHSSSTSSCRDACLILRAALAVILFLLAPGYIGGATPALGVGFAVLGMFLAMGILNQTSGAPRR